MNYRFDSYLIREWKESDIPSLGRHANNRNIYLNLTDMFPHPYTKDDAAQFIDLALSPDTQDEYFAIVDGNDAIGSVVFIN